MFDIVANLTSTKPAALLLPPPSLLIAPAPKTGRRLTIHIPSSPVAESEFNLPAALLILVLIDVIRVCSSRLRHLSSIFIKSMMMMIRMIGKKRKLSREVVFGLLQEGG